MSYIQKYPRWTPPPTTTDKIVDAIFMTFVVGAFVTSPYAGYFLVRGAINYLFKKADLNRELKRLAKKQYVALTKTPDGWLAKITKKGKVKLKKIQFQNLSLKKPAKWDKCWRLFVFDVPEKHRSARDMMRKKLKNLGLFNIQRSVFAYPFDCRKELELVTDYYRLSKYTTYVEAHYTDINKELLKHFKSLINKK